MLQTIRSHGEVDVAVHERCHVDQAISKVASFAMPPRQRGERLLLVITVVVHRSVRERLQRLDQSGLHGGLARRIVSPIGLVLSITTFADQETCEVVSVLVRNSFKIHY